MFKIIADVYNADILLNLPPGSYQGNDDDDDDEFLDANWLSVSRVTINIEDNFDTCTCIYIYMYPTLSSH